MSSDMRWGHASDKDSDEWIGSFETKEEAIEDGNSYYAYAGGVDSFWVRSGTVPPPTFYLPDAEDILQIMHERACDEVGSNYVDDFPCTTEHAKRMLNAFLRNWCDTHISVDFCVFNGKPEWVPERQE